VATYKIFAKRGSAIEFFRCFYKMVGQKLGLLKVPSHALPLVPGFILPNRGILSYLEFMHNLLKSRKIKSFLNIRIALFIVYRLYLKGLTSLIGVVN